MPRTFRFYLALTTAYTLTACQVVDSFLGVPPTKPTPPSSAIASSVPNPEPLSFPATHPVPFSAKDTTYFKRWNGKEYQRFYIKGVNLGLGLPGTQAGDLAASREQFQRWFKRMRELGFNTLRVYTLHFPRFYEELARYNAAHPNAPLYVFQGIWLDEAEGAAHDLYKDSAFYDQGMHEVVDAIHGTANIAERQGKAYGAYTANISRWVMGWIIGREVAPDEVILTNQSHPDKMAYQGQNISIKGNPTEVWWTERMDQLISYERNRYKVDRPISVSSWPTLDPLRHPTENPRESQEDVAQVDFAQLEMSNMPAGYFPSFHAYPYYPDFINYEPAFLKERDSQGVNNYIGYIKALKKHYANMPLVIGEYGLPSSWGNAHYSPSGMNHGGLTELEQSQGVARLTRDLYENNTAGGMVFAWIDEWWKRTWIVDDLALPRSRYRLWHNMTSPEQNFGLVAFEPPKPAYQSVGKGTGKITGLEAAADVAYFHLKVSTSTHLGANEELQIAFDTYRDDLGETILPNGSKTKRRNEFTLVLTGHQQAQLMVTQAYDLFAIWHRLSGSQQLYQSAATQGAQWVPVRWQNNQERTSADGTQVFPMATYPIGQLGIRRAEATPSSKDAVIVGNGVIDIRIPWTLLNITDPSTRSVMHDNRLTPEHETVITEGIAVTVAWGNEQLESSRYLWPGWESAPPVDEREKQGLPILQKALLELPEDL